MKYFNKPFRERGAALATLTVLPALAALPAGSSANELEVLMTFNTEMLSEPEPLDATFDDWGSQFREGERQWVLAEAELGVRVNGVEIAFQRRALADIRMNEQAAEFYGRIDRNEPLEPGETVPVNIAINGLSATGLRAGYRFEEDTWSLGASASVLHTQHLMSGDLNGEFEAIAETDYNFNAEVDYHYYREPIFERPDINTATGLGWAFQLFGEWQATEQVYLSANVDDLFAKVRWEEAPFTRAQAHTERKRYDDEGYAVFDPFFTGQEGYRSSYYQELDPRAEVNAEVSAGGLLLHAQGKHQFGYSYAGFGAGYDFGDAKLKAMHWPALDAYGAQLDVGQFSAAVSVDSVRWSDAHYVALDVSYGY